MNLTYITKQLPSATNKSDPNVLANQDFLKFYTVSQLELTPKVKIITEPNHVVLILSNGTRIIEDAVTDLYHNLKMISHCPLGA